MQGSCRGGRRVEKRPEAGRYRVVMTGKLRNRLFVYDRYVSILNEGAESPEG